VERRVFVSVNSDRTLDPRRQLVKRAILEELRAAELSPQVFFEAGLPQGLPWSFANVESVMRRCIGALVIGFPRWRATSHGGAPVKLIGEYSHFEGGVALALNVPTLITVETGLQEHGIVYAGGGAQIVSFADDVAPTRLFDGEFGRAFDDWLGVLLDRRDVFLGYCSASSSIALRLQRMLEADGVTLHNWEMDFRSGKSILSEVERARDLCGRAIFIFSEDDQLEGTASQAAPRDNVVFETGYFIGSRGPANTLIIRIGNARMPADLGGIIYLSLGVGEDPEELQTAVARFVQRGIE